MRLLGVDTGGTFTDFVLLEGGRLRVHKVLSTPEAPERAILQGIAELGGAAGLAVVHGSTVATNALLEGKGARTAFVTNRGLRDLLAIGRQARHGLYDLAPAPVAPPVPAALCLETGGRLGADGRVVEALTEDDLALLRDQLAGLAPEAVAVDLLFSFLDPRFERAVAAVAPPDAFVACSHEVLPEVREYERGIATWIAASLGPRVAGYLSRLAAALPGTPLAVMQSSGQTVGAAAAARRAVHLLLSGPAGGLAGARRVAARCRAEGGAAAVLTFDMGGTSTDVALVEGDDALGGEGLTREGRIAGHPVAVPMVDIHTIGAGGGSIAWRDAGGMLRVGPRSAGAAPGPACYGRGGTEPTVTDANLVLGRLVPDAFLGGRLALDRAAAERAVGGLAAALGLGLEACALGIVRLADEHMANALRVMSVQRGRDPRELALLSFGGAGGLHVCALAEALGMRQAIVPARAGVLSAYGMLAAPRGRDLSRSVVGAEAARWLADPVALEAAFVALEGEARAALAAEGLREAPVARRRVDLRYRGQHHSLAVPWPPGGASATGPGARRALEDAFHELHLRRHGHALAMPVELVAIGSTVGVPAAALPDAAPADEPLAGRATTTVAAVGAPGPVTVIARAALERGVLLAGPAIVLDAHATTWLAPGWRARVDRAGHLHLSRPG